MCVSACCECVSVVYVCECCARMLCVSVSVVRECCVCLCMCEHVMCTNAVRECRACVCVMCVSTHSCDILHVHVRLDSFLKVFWENIKN